MRKTNQTVDGIDDPSVRIPHNDEENLHRRLILRSTNSTEAYWIASGRTNSDAFHPVERKANLLTGE